MVLLKKKIIKKITFKETNVSERYYMLLKDLKLYRRSSLIEMFKDYGIQFPSYMTAAKNLLNIAQKFIICKKIAPVIEAEEPISPLLVTDSQGRIDIFTWFSSFSDLERFLGCDQTHGMVSRLCKKRNLTEEEVIKYSDDQLLVNPVLALLAANSMNDSFRCKVNELFIIDRNEQLKGEAIRKEARKARLIFEDEGLVDYGIQFQALRWPFSEIKHGFYIIQMDNLVKAGGTGMHANENYISVKKRFSAHRVTNCEFKLRALFEFDNSEAAEVFEIFSKFVLKEYRVGSDERSEQYKCPGQDSGKVVVRIVSEQFRKMKLAREDQKWRKLSKKEVALYNRISAEDSAPSSPEVSP